MLPISLVSAINPVAGAAMSGLNTAGKTSRDAIESGNGIGDALAYGLVAGSVDFALNALSSTAFQARGAKGASWGEKFISRVAKTEGGDLALRTIAGTLVDTGADTLSLLMQHNIKKMYDPNYKETLSEEEVLKTIAVSLVVNGGMRLGTNMSKGVYETDADGMLKPLDEARMMGQMTKNTNYDTLDSKVYIPIDGDGAPIPLRKQKVNGQDIPLPDPQATGRAHTVLGGKKSSKTGDVYRQSASFPENTWPTANGYDVPWSEVHWTNHGRGDHFDPHQHGFTYDPKNGWVRGGQTRFY